MAELAQPVAAEIHRVERDPQALLKIRAERLVAQRGIAREVFDRYPVSTDLLDDLEYAFNRELEEECDVTYREFEDPEELRGASVGVIQRRTAKAVRWESSAAGAPSHSQ